MFCKIMKTANLMINSGVQNERHSNLYYITFRVRMFRKQTCISEVMIISALMCIASVTKDKKCYLSLLLGLGSYAI